MADVRGLEAKLRRHAVLLMESARLDVEFDTQAAAPRATGELANSVTSSPARDDGGDSVTAVIEARAAHAVFVVKGTRPHDIKPRVKKALHWGGDPGTFAKVVHHRGTKPNEAFWSADALARRLRHALDSATRSVRT